MPLLLTFCYFDMLNFYWCLDYFAAWNKYPWCLCKWFQWRTGTDSLSTWILLQLWSFSMLDFQLCNSFTLHPRNYLSYAHKWNGHLFTSQFFGGCITTPHPLMTRSSFSLFWQAFIQNLALFFTSFYKVLFLFLFLAPKYGFMLGIHIVNNVMNDL